MLPYNVESMFRLLSPVLNLVMPVSCFLSQSPGTGWMEVSLRVSVAEGFQVQRVRVTFIYLIITCRCSFKLLLYLEFSVGFAEFCRVSVR